MGLAKRMLGNYGDAKRYLEKALRLDPENSTIGQELVIVIFVMFFYEHYFKPHLCYFWYSFHFTMYFRSVGLKSGKYGLKYFKVAFHQFPESMSEKITK